VSIEKVKSSNHQYKRSRNISLSFMFKSQVALAIASLAIFSSHAADLDIGFYDNVLACKGDSVNVNWEGFHNIHETLGSSCDSGDMGEIEGYLENGTGKTYSNDELSAAPGERRYFKCSAHCGVQSSRFEVYCPPVEVDYGFNNNVLACKGDSVKVNWKGYHNIHETKGSGCDSGDMGEVETYWKGGTEKTFLNDELSAAPGERRYFKCSAHCGEEASRFEVYCPVEVDYGFNNNVLACTGTSIRVNWKGFHNIHETKGSGCDSGDLGEKETYLSSGHTETYSSDELSAAPGERRYFKCSAHCGEEASRFETYCPSADVCSGLNKKKCKLVKDSCSFGKSKIFTGCKAKKTKYVHDCAQHDNEDTCAEDNYHKGLCKFGTTGLCSHVCEHLGNKTCRKFKNTHDNKKTCKPMKQKNPCKGCKPKGSCSNQ